MTRKASIGLVVVLTMTLVSCSTMKSQKLTYEHVNFQDGIVNWEAILIAQEELKRKFLETDYHFDYPNLFLEPQYPNKWFVQFAPLYMGTRLTDYLIIIDMPTGKIQFSNYWMPSEKNLDEIISGE